MGSVLRSSYAWVLLSVIIIPLFPAAWIFRFATRSIDPRGDRLRTLVARWASVYGFASPLYHFDFRGREHIPRSGPYVLVANHESGLDVLLLLMLGTPARFLAEHWIFRVPLAGPLLRLCRHIPVKIGDRESGRRALELAAESLAEGTPVAVFPEGGYAQGELGEFRPGAFVAAHRAGVPLVPMRLQGTGRAWAPGTVVVEGRNEIRIEILEPVSGELAARMEPEVLSKLVRERMAAVEPLVR